MKKAAIALVFSFLAVLIVLPVITSVNHSAGKQILTNGSFRADGSPLPAPVPPDAFSNTILTADGSPLPAPVPPDAFSNTILTADGSPLPAPVPPDVFSKAILTANG